MRDEGPRDKQYVAWQWDRKLYLALQHSDRRALCLLQVVSWGPLLKHGQGGVNRHESNASSRKTHGDRKDVYPLFTYSRDDEV